MLTIHTMHPAIYIGYRHQNLYVRIRGQRKVDHFASAVVAVAADRKGCWRQSRSAAWPYDSIDENRFPQGYLQEVSSCRSNQHQTHEDFQCYQMCLSHLLDHEQEVMPIPNAVRCPLVEAAGMVWRQVGATKAAE